MVETRYLSICRSHWDWYINVWQTYSKKNHTKLMTKKIQLGFFEFLDYIQQKQDQHWNSFNDLHQIDTLWIPNFGPGGAGGKPSVHIMAVWSTMNLKNCSPYTAFDKLPSNSRYRTFSWRPVDTEKAYIWPDLWAVTSSVSPRSMKLGHRVDPLGGYLTSFEFWK